MFYVRTYVLLTLGPVNISAGSGILMSVGGKVQLFLNQIYSTYNVANVRTVPRKCKYQISTPCVE